MGRNAPIHASWIPIFIAAFLFILSSCGQDESNVSDSGQSSEQNDWTFEDPEHAGLIQDSLDAITRDIQNGIYPNTHALLIEYDGQLVYEQYFDGTDECWGTDLGYRKIGKDSLHDLRSISKSITSLLLGIALKDSLEDKVNRPISSYFPSIDLDSSKHSITLHHILTMTPGLAWNEMDVPYTDDTNDEIRTYDARDPAKYALERPLVHTPGTVWYYSGGTTQVLASVIYNLTGQSLDSFAADNLFEPLNITRFEWLGPGTWEPDNPAAMSGLRLTARDLAKVGSLFLNSGRWSGNQIVPEEWIDLSGARHVKEISDWSANGQWGYGYQWWVGTLPDGTVTIAGVGNGNQRLFILPSDKLSVTIFAGEYNKFEGHSNRLMYRIQEARSKAVSSGN